MTTETNEPTAPVAPVTLDTTPAPAPAAPAAAPVAPVADGVIEYEPTGDVGLDMALTFIGKAGIAEDHPAMVAATNGDFSILKAALAAKNVQGWEQFVALGEAAYQRKTNDAKTAEEATRSIVHLEAGGPEQWAEIQKWASANATPEEKVAINAQLNAGGVSAKMAARYLTSLYDKASNVVVNPRDPTANAGRNGGAPSGDTAPLSAREYATAVQLLNVKLAGRLDGSPEYAKLQQRRAAYRG